MHTDRVLDPDLRSLSAVGADYPQAELRLLYRGAERLEIRGMQGQEPCRRDRIG